jgi:hypothetical protein
MEREVVWKVRDLFINAAGEVAAAPSPAGKVIFLRKSGVGF